MWWLLVVSSIPLHLLYNSAAVTMLSAYEYRVIFVTPEFLPGAGKDTTVHLTPNITKVYSLIRDNPQTFEMLTQAEIYTVYTRNFVTNRNDVIIILNSTEYEAQLKSPVSIMPTTNYSTPTPPIKIFRGFIQDKLEETHQKPLLLDSQVEIEGCLTKKAKEGCRLWICSSIFIVLMVYNLVKAAVMVTIFRRRKPTSHVVNYNGGRDRVVSRKSRSYHGRYASRRQRAGRYHLGRRKDSPNPLPSAPALVQRLLPKKIDTLFIYNRVGIVLVLV